MYATQNNIKYVIELTPWAQYFLISNSRSAGQQIYFTEAGCSIPCLQQKPIGSYPEPVVQSTLLHNNSLMYIWILFSHVLLRFLSAVSYLGFSD
jgi:hypothetical protein